MVVVVSLVLIMLLPLLPRPTTDVVLRGETTEEEVVDRPSTEPVLLRGNSEP